MKPADSQAAAPPAVPPAAPATPANLHAYPRAARIVRTDEFSSVFHLRPVRRSAHFMLYVRPTALPRARLGIVAAKRFAPRAVTRNTIKRITREIFRQSSLPGGDCIVRLTRPVNSKADPATSTRLKTTLRSELHDLLHGYFKAAKQPEKPSEKQSEKRPDQPPENPPGNRS
ncbi:MAG TPA: ribonuclease P protein component [Noviherbaspirillum sp.]|nr:ribonuclease P protein component [Noviherbaspirillum sp.]